MSYKKLRFVSYDINTAPKDPVFKYGYMPKGTYLGLDCSREDIEARCLLTKRAIEAAATKLNSIAPDEGEDTLRVFVIPEFYMRGKEGAYLMDQVDYAIRCLKELVSDEKWKDWLFVFGSVVARILVDSSGNEDAPDIAYNFSPVQKGGSASKGPTGARVVAKELKSDIDFISEEANENGILLGDVEHLQAGRSGPGRERQQVNYDGAGIFSLDGIEWALEICLDHLENRLQKSPQLPGEKQVQVQLVPSCGADAEDDAVVTMLGGFLFNCDGGGFGTTLNKVIQGLHGIALDPIAKEDTASVAATDIVLPGSTPKNISISELYAHGAGKIIIFPTQDCPAEKVVPGKTIPLVWKPQHAARFTFNLNYDDSENFMSLLCQIRLVDLDMHDHDYFMPLELNTKTRSGKEVSISMRIIGGSHGYDYALWCEIDVPGFQFEGVALQFYKSMKPPKDEPHKNMAPEVIWP